jgi:hypothetical protein
MVGMQMSLALVETLSQLGPHLFNGRRAQLELPEVCHHGGLPAAIHTPPLVADEAKNSQTAMIGIIAAFCRSPSPLIMLPLRLPLVLGAIRSRVAESSAARRVAWTFGQARHPELVLSPV